MPKAKYEASTAALKKRIEAQDYPYQSPAAQREYPD